MEEVKILAEKVKVCRAIGACLLHIGCIRWLCSCTNGISPALQCATSIVRVLTTTGVLQEGGRQPLPELPGVYARLHPAGDKSESESGACRIKGRRRIVATVGSSSTLPPYGPHGGLARGTRPPGLL